MLCLLARASFRARWAQIIPTTYLPDLPDRGVTDQNTGICIQAWPAQMFTTQSPDLPDRGVTDEKPHALPQPMEQAFLWSRAYTP